MSLTTAIVCLAMVPAAGNDNDLKAVLFDNDNLQFAFLSTYVESPAKGHLISNTFSSYDRNGSVLAKVTTGEQASVEKATAGADGTPVPRMVSMTRTTYRPVVDTTIGVGGLVSPTNEKFSISGTGWTESDKSVVPTPGSQLEAKLIDGDVTDKTSVRFRCSVSGSKEKGYAMTYTVENGYPKDLSFRWAGMDGNVKSHGTFTKTFSVDRVTPERSETAIVEFKGVEAPFRLKANVWSRP